MDKENKATLQRMQRGLPDSKATVKLFGDYADTEGKAEIIEDPYYGGRSGFETAYEQAVRFSEGFLKNVFHDVAGEEAMAGSAQKAA
jgi:low molecular weight phosphotyrosine protein phosphatase